MTVASGKWINWVRMPFGVAALSVATQVNLILWMPDKMDNLSVQAVFFGLVPIHCMFHEIDFLDSDTCGHNVVCNSGILLLY